MGTRQRMGLAVLIMAGFLIVLWGGPEAMTRAEGIRGAVYLVSGTLAFVWPERANDGPPEA